MAAPGRHARTDSTAPPGQDFVARFRPRVALRLASHRLRSTRGYTPWPHSGPDQTASDLVMKNATEKVKMP